MGTNLLGLTLLWRKLNEQSTQLMLNQRVMRMRKEHGHMVIVLAEGARQDLMSKSMESNTLKDASGNQVLKDVGFWLSQSIKDPFKKIQMVMNLKYIDPTYMIWAVLSNASDNVYCTLLAQSVVHGAMAGYTGYTSGLVNGRQTYIPYYRITEKQNNVVIMFWKVGFKIKLYLPLVSLRGYDYQISMVFSMESSRICICIGNTENWRSLYQNRRVLRFSRRQLGY
ncbi:unnamed protein product [Thlaspi arvense]|uniref:Phosphofructokinase domain-containing protein n=1 Tax=Thlaspi arvense TaxID=13288 RepID=A0AAU9SWR7_THLAR|nr:unnamed protein product [Thlaspi arvense]